MDIDKSTTKGVWFGTSFNESLKCDQMKFLSCFKRHCINPWHGHWTFVYLITQDILIGNVDSLHQNIFGRGGNENILGVFTWRITLLKRICKDCEGWLKIEHSKGLMLKGLRLAVEINLIKKTNPTIKG